MGYWPSLPVGPQRGRPGGPLCSRGCQLPCVIRHGYVIIFLLSHEKVGFSVLGCSGLKSRVQQSLNKELGCQSQGEQMCGKRKDRTHGRRPAGSGGHSWVHLLSFTPIFEVGSHVKGETNLFNCFCRFSVEGYCEAGDSRDGKM